MEFVIWGLAGCCCRLTASSSSFLVSCSPSWPSVIGLSLFSPVMKRCRIESSVTAHLLVPILNFHFVMENFFRKSKLELIGFIQSFRRALYDEMSVTGKHVLRVSISIWVLIRRRPGSSYIRIRSSSSPKSELLSAYSMYAFSCLWREDFK